MNIFESARIRLTLWYLLIIMTISLTFSAFIYRSFSNELTRRLENIELRLGLSERGLQLPPGQKRYFAQDIKDTRGAVLIVLFYTNGIIFIFSFAAGYVLAGKTLKPIEDALDQQKRFVTDASHELKTPLAAMQIATEVALRDKKLTKELAVLTLKENLVEMEKMKNLSNNLLLLAKTNGNARKTFETFSTPEIKKLDPMFAKLAKQKKIKFVSTVKPLTIYASKESVLQLITLLLDNAIKYTHKGTVRLAVGKAGKNLKIVVSDSGIGIARQDLPNIFDRFYRVDSSRSKSIEGFGLGLSIVKKIVASHNGDIKVTSVPTKGSVFTVLLPVL